MPSHIHQHQLRKSAFSLSSQRKKMLPIQVSCLWWASRTVYKLYLYRKGGAPLRRRNVRSNCKPRMVAHEKACHPLYRRHVCECEVFVTFIGIICNPRVIKSKEKEPAPKHSKNSPCTEKTQKQWATMAMELDPMTCWGYYITKLAWERFLDI